MNKEDRLKLFANELGDISDINLRRFAEELIANADEYFFTVAASTSGKYHPPFDQGLGGLVRHTRVVAYFAKEVEAIGRMYSKHDTDLLIIAALAHDIKKLGDGSGKHTTNDHPAWARNYVIEMQSKNPELISVEDAEKIAKAVHSHMGQWGAKDGMPLPSNDFEWSLHMADMAASRKEILDFKFRATDVAVVTESVAPVANVNVEPKDYIIDFGKHRGKTISEINAIDSGWIDWVLKQTDFNNKEAYEMVKKFCGK